MQNIKQYKLKSNRIIRLAFDLDATLLDFDEKIFIEFAKQSYFFDDLQDMFDKMEQDSTLSEKHKEIYYTSGFYSDLPPISGAIEAYKYFDKLYDCNGKKMFELYVLSAPSINNLTCCMDKFNDIRKYFGEDALERTILSRDKTLIDIDILIDDNINVKGANGSTDSSNNKITFEHIRFRRGMYRYENNPSFKLINNWTDDIYKDIIIGTCCELDLLEIVS